LRIWTLEPCLRESRALGALKAAWHNLLHKLGISAQVCFIEILKIFYFWQSAENLTSETFRHGWAHVHKKVSK
jgi:hypothetical protein